MQGEEVEARGDDDLDDPGAEVGGGQLALAEVRELVADVLIQGHVAGHNDELVVPAEGGTPLVLEVHGGPLEELEEVGVGHPAPELELVPEEERVDAVPVVGEPVGDIQVVDGTELLDPADEGGLPGVGGADQEQLSRLEGTGEAVSYNLIQMVYDPLEARPGIIRPELLGGKRRLDQGAGDGAETGPVTEE